jgi:hypothetical protein
VLTEEALGFVVRVFRRTEGETVRMGLGVCRFFRRSAVTGAKVGGAAAVTATAVLGSFAMTGSPAGALAPPSSAPQVTTYDGTCSALDGAIVEPVTVSFFGQAPGATHQGAQVFLAGVRETVTFPPSTVFDAIGEGLNPLIGTATADMNATNTTTGTVNMTPTPIPFNLPLTLGQPATFTVLTPTRVGPWTAGGSGTITFTPGAITLDISLATFTCTPNSPTVVGTTVIRP